MCSATEITVDTEEEKKSKIAFLCDLSDLCGGAKKSPGGNRDFSFQVEADQLRAGLRHRFAWAGGGSGSLARGTGGHFHLDLRRRLGHVLDPQVQVWVERRAGRDEVA